MPLKDTISDALKKSVTAISDEASEEGKRAKTMFHKIASYPFKVLASFLAAPILLVMLAWRNPGATRWFALIGLLLAVAAGYMALTILGTFAGALFVASEIGWLAGIAFLLGTTLSDLLRYLFSLAILNVVCFVALKISRQEIIDYLKELITPTPRPQTDDRPAPKTSDENPAAKNDGPNPGRGR